MYKLYIYMYIQCIIHNYVTLVGVTPIIFAIIIYQSYFFLH